MRREKRHTNFFRIFEEDSNAMDRNKPPHQSTYISIAEWNARASIQEILMGKKILPGFFRYAACFLKKKEEEVLSTQHHDAGQVHRTLSRD